MPQKIERPSVSPARLGLEPYLISKAEYSPAARFLQAKSPRATRFLLRNWRCAR
jgi:hypothetical protein